MKQEHYEYLAKKITSVPWGMSLLKSIGECLTFMAVLAYIGMLLRLSGEREWKRAAVLLFVPMFSFIAVSILRRYLGQKRPYEKYDIKPLIPKDTKEHSFPSRHVFSIYVIGTSLFFYRLPLGILLCILGIGLAIIRVVAGVHFPRDVIVGAVLGILSGGLTGLFLWILGLL